MNKERLKKLDDLKKELGIPDTIFRNVLAYTLMLTPSFYKSFDDDKTLNLALESLKRVDMNYVQNHYYQKSNPRKYSKEIVQQTIEELAKKNTK